jgi:hypothetical protein
MRLAKLKAMIACQAPNSASSSYEHGRVHFRLVEALLGYFQLSGVESISLAIQSVVFSSFSSLLTSYAVDH